MTEDQPGAEGAGVDHPCDREAGAAGDGASLASRALSRVRASAFERGHMRGPARSSGRPGADDPAPWDAPRRRVGVNGEGGGDPESEDWTDRAPGLATDRGRPGPSRFDPRTAKKDLARMVDRKGWAGMLAVAGVAARWEEIVGRSVAEHSRVESFEPGRITIRASSSSWAQQLRLMMPTILRRISEEVGGAGVDVHVLGPAGPSWRHGRFPVRGGRGPRDTYG
ncbi:MULTISPECIES: DUF721 domain-containing protein [Actinomyces]|uniref:DUF721 domain-containing protein n=1 Tax=Actinomyces TaxID=1654 RepID=UPI001F36DFFF|nr:MULTISPECIES: DciA family protein [Actinomyces]